MAFNENPERENKHTIYTATSGGGKSQVLGQNPEIPQNARRIYWDPHNDFKCDHYQTIASFSRALKKVCHKKQFKIGFNGKATQANFDRFCALVMLILNGDLETYIIIDEVAEVTGGPGKARGGLGELLRGSRKYGGILHLTATRPAEIPKTLFTQCKRKYIGQMDSVSDAKAMADYLMIDYRAVLDLEPMQFYRKYPGKPAEKMQQKYKKAPL